MIKQSITLMPVILIGTFLLTVVREVLNGLRQYYTDYVQEIMSLEIRTKFYRHLQRLSFSFYDSREVAEVLSRFDDAGQSRAILIECVNIIMTNITYLIVIPFIVFSMNWKLTLLAGLTVPWMISSMVGLSKLNRKYSRLHAEKKAENDAKLYETISGLREIQSLVTENMTFRMIKRLFLQRRKLRIYLDTYQNLEDCIAEIMTALGTLCYMWYGVSLVAKGHLTVGEFLAFSTFVEYMYESLEKIYKLMVPIQKAIVYTDRFYEIYDTKSEIENPADPVKIDTLKGGIQLQNVQFSYDTSRKTLKNINLTIDPGKMVAIVGRTGSGKSSLVKLLPRFYSPESGMIKINGIDIKRYALDQLRKNISFVSQDPFIFSGTIKDNITGGRNGYSWEEIIHASQQANLHNFITTSLPQKYYTHIGEHGARLSGGEKQRIALARCFLLNRPIIILDESTSQLDTQTEYVVQQNLIKFQGDKIIIAIAHRINTVKNADIILVMDKGEIVEQGHYYSLIERKGEFYNFYKKY